MLAELMEMSSESDGRLGLGEGSEQVSGVKEGGAMSRPGRQLGGSARGVFVVDVVTVVTVGIICKGSSFTSGWRPRPRTCPSLSRAVAWERGGQENIVIRSSEAGTQQHSR